MANASPSYCIPHGLRAVVVEDETLVAIFLEDLLEELGCRVVGTATQVSRAISLVETLHPDIAVVDINLTGEDSYPVAELLHRRGIPFVFATGYGDGLVHPDWRHYPVIHKPYQKSDLERAIVQVLDGDVRTSDQMGKAHC